MMINLNKKEKIAKGLPLAIKVMSLMVMLNLVGCNGCNSGDNELAGPNTAIEEDGNHNPEIKLSIHNAMISGDQKKAKIIIVNDSDKEINFNEEDLKLICYKPKMIESGTFWGSTQSQKANIGKYGAYTVGEKHGSLSAETSIFSLKELLKNKKLGVNQVLSLKFEFIGLTQEGANKINLAEVLLEIQDAKGRTVSESPAKVVWKQS